MSLDASMCEKEEADISELMLGTECGGSDPTSGLAANPTLGYVSDKLVSLGATSILSETTELMGTEDILAARCVDERVAKDLLDMIKNNEEHFALAGENIRDGNPSPETRKADLRPSRKKIPRMHQ